jgi:hypothetical protein
MAGVALVTVPVSTALLVIKRRCKRVTTSKVVWPESGGGSGYGSDDDNFVVTMTML